MKKALCCVACLFLLIGSALAREEFQEYAWITAADKDTGIVEIQTISTKISITFEPATAEDTLWFMDRVGYIATVNFDCAAKEGKKENCDYSKPYVFSADGRSAKMVGWHFLQKPREARVNGPGDKNGLYPEGLMVSGKIGKNDFFLYARFADASKNSLVGAMKRDDKIEIEFLENNPHIVRVHGVEMYITIFKVIGEGITKP